MPSRDSVEFKITGTAELVKALEQLPPQVARSMVKKNLGRAARPWYAEMKSKVRQGWHVWKSTIVGKAHYGGRSREYGALSRLIGIRVRLDSDELGGTAQVGPVKKGFWALWLEFGKRGGRKFPFIRPAFDAKKDEVLNLYAEGLRSELKTKMGLK
jgi:HK97 gp10 family phage protein